MTGLIWANDIAAMLETGCSYSQATVDSLGVVVEQFIQAELDMNNLPVNPVNVSGSGVGMLMVASQNWLCRDIRIMQKHDGTIPNSLSAGPTREDVAIDVSIKFYDDKGRAALDKYILSQTGTDEDDVAQYAGLLALAGEDL
jgi:hypothetical protein